MGKNTGLIDRHLNILSSFSRLQKQDSCGGEVETDGARGKELMAEIIAVVRQTLYEPQSEDKRVNNSL